MYLSNLRLILNIKTEMGTKQIIKTQTNKLKPRCFSSVKRKNSNKFHKNLI